MEHLGCRTAAFVIFVRSCSAYLALTRVVKGIDDRRDRIKADYDDRGSRRKRILVAYPRKQREVEREAQLLPAPKARPGGTRSRGQDGVRCAAHQDGRGENRASRGTGAGGRRSAVSMPPLAGGSAA